MTEQGSFKKNDCTESSVLRESAEILLSEEQVDAFLVDLLCSAAETHAHHITLLYSLSLSD